LLRSALLLLVLCVACSQVPPAATSPHVALRLIAFNDFHGHLETPPMGLILPTGRVNAGGAAHLATAMKSLRRGHANSAVVAAGDLVSASPVISSLARDEPTVDALGEAGLGNELGGQPRVRSRTRRAPAPAVDGALPVARRQRDRFGHRQTDPSPYAIRE
jgi:5'-nucleotidase